MENEKEKNYFIIWLYISILLHLFVVIIMLSIKPAQSQSKEPDPGNATYGPTQVIFVQDQEEPEPPQEPIKQDFKMASRTQGGTTTIEPSGIAQKPAEQDMPTPALSDEYKKAMHNQTTSEEQGEDGQVNISEQALLAPEEQLETQVLAPAQALMQSITPTSVHDGQESVDTTLASGSKYVEPDEQTSTAPTAGELLKAVIAEKMAQAKQELEEAFPESKSTHQALQPLPEKVVSKKHRPADLGTENLSKLQLSKITPDDKPIAKKKLSLQDLQQGFTQFIRNNQTQQTDGSYATVARPGNSAFFSSIGNATTDDAQGLRMASYLRQVGQMYHSAHQIFPRYQNLQKQTPTDDSIIMITIERSGKISQCEMISSCGIASLDKYHIDIIESIGSFPPIPKYIEAPLKIPATLYFSAAPRSNFVPTVRRK